MDSSLLHIVTAEPGVSFPTISSTESEFEAILVIQPGDHIANGAGPAILEVLHRYPKLDGVIADSTVGPLNGNYSLRLEPAWSPELLRHRPDHAATLVVRQSTVARLGGPESISPAGIHAWALRLAEAGADIAHVPGVLVHRESDPWLDPAQSRVAINDHLRRSRISAQVRVDADGRCVTVPHFDVQPSVSVVIPSAGNSDPNDPTTRLLDRCLESLVARTEWSSLEIILVDDNLSRQAIANAREVVGPGLVIVSRPPGPFDFSAAVMAGALAAHGDLVLMLNDDTEVPASASPDWLANMAVEAQRPDVGAVGALLTYPDGTLQHAGLVIDDAAPLHAFLHRFPTDRTISGLIQGPRIVIAVTGAALLVRRDRLFAVGGLSSTLPLSFNDVDLCLKLARHGFHTVFVPAAHLIHHESASREATLDKWEWDTWVGRWGAVEDPWYHPAYVRYRRPHARHLDAGYDTPTNYPVMSDQPCARRGEILPRVHHPKILPPDEEVQEPISELSPMTDPEPSLDPILGNDLDTLRSEILRLRDLVEGAAAAAAVYLDRIDELEIEVESYHELGHAYKALRASPTFRLATVLAAPARLFRRGKLMPDS